MKKAANELRMRLWAVLAHGGLIVPAMTVGCASTVSPSGDAAQDATVASMPDAVSNTTCPGMTRMTRTCMTTAEVEANIRGGVGFMFDAGSPTDAAIDAVITAPREANGCYVPSAVLSGCCNPAVSVAREGETCCYLWCEMACCGRPLVIDGEARIAGLSASPAWTQNDIARVRGLDAVTRDALAKAWRADALLEHASIASFARFTLQLIAAGAPPDLLADAHRAGLDEIEHARLCFALATAIDGASVGPGPLDLAGVRVSASLDEAVRSTIVEGCVGETIASLLASAQRDVAEHAPARDALARIARDEGTHAELAWRFVAWAITVGGEPIRRAASEAFDEAMKRPVAVPSMPAGVDAQAWREHGRLTATEAAAVVRMAGMDVIRPCANALLVGTQPCAPMA